MITPPHYRTETRSFRMGLCTHLLPSRKCTHEPCIELRRSRSCTGEAGTIKGSQHCLGLCKKSRAFCQRGSTAQNKSHQEPQLAVFKGVCMGREFKKEGGGSVHIKSPLLTWPASWTRLWLPLPLIQAWPRHPDVNPPCRRVTRRKPHAQWTSLAISRGVWHCKA